MSFDFDKQIDLAIAGFLAPIIGLIVSTILSIFETIPTNQMEVYTFVIWGTILLIDVGSLLQDLNSIRVNGPVYGICFVMVLYL